MYYKKEIDEWWEKFEGSSTVNDKIELIKEVANLKKPKEFYENLEIGDAIFEYIEPEFKYNLSGYYNFLKSLMDNYTDIFDLDAAWHIRWLLKYYTYSGSTKEVIKSAINYLIEHPKDEPDIIFDILDYLIINEFVDEAWELYQFYFTFFNKSESIISSGLNELSVLGSIFIVSRENEENIKKELKKYDYHQEDNILNERIAILRSKNYAGKDWHKEDFKGKKGTLNFYFLSLEFARSIRDKYNLVTAHFLQQVLFDYYCEVGIDNFKFNKQKTDELLATYAGMFSLTQTRAFIILGSIKLFYDFLKQNGMITDKDYHLSMKGVINLKDSLYKAFEKEIWKYHFAEKIMGGQNETKNTF